MNVIPCAQHPGDASVSDLIEMARIAWRYNARCIIRVLWKNRSLKGCGGEFPEDWSWLAPPMSGSACPVFHRYYAESRPEPAFVDQARAW